MIIINEMNPKHLQKLKDNNSGESLWYNNTTLYNYSGDIVGKINKDKNKIKLFITSA